MKHAGALGRCLALLLSFSMVAVAAPAHAQTAKSDQLALLINRARVAEGLKPLARNPDLDRAAEAHSQDMARHSYLDHAAPDGSEPMDRAIRAGYGARKGTGWIVVEIISAISGEPEGPLNWWLKESPAVHGRVLRNPRWREMGVGYAAGGEYGNYWTVLVGCQPGVLPVVELDGVTHRHAEECDQSPAPPVEPKGPRLVANADSGRVDVRWQGVANAHASDWIGLYRPTDPDTRYMAWSYLDCAPDAGGPREEGACALRVPPNLPSGDYEVRLYRGARLERLAQSNRVSLRPPPLSSRASLSTLEDSVRAGEPLRVVWSGIPSPTRRDWLALTSAEQPDAPPSAWAYVSCGGAPDQARTGGLCEMEVPPATRPGKYELSLLAEDAYAPWASTTVFISPPRGADAAASAT